MRWRLGFLINIAICEDEEVYMNSIKSIINKNFNGNVLCFKSGEELLETLNNNNRLAEIYIMDIELTGVNGLETAHKIRQVDKYAIIIFVTNYEHYVFDSFEVNTFRFIPKNKIDELAVKALNDAIAQIKLHERYKFIYLKTKDKGIVRIDFDDIISIERVGKYTEFSLKNGSLIRDNRTIKYLLNEIKKEGFIIAQKGIIVNIGNIIAFNDNVLTMSDNSVRYVSRNYMKSVKIAIAKYWR